MTADDEVSEILDEVEPSIIRLLEEYEKIEAYYMPAAQMEVVTVIAGSNTTTHG